MGDAGERSVGNQDSFVAIAKELNIKELKKRSVPQMESAIAGRHWHKARMNADHYEPCTR
jgi:hypothetical protein